MFMTFRYFRRLVLAQEWQISGRKEESHFVYPPVQLKEKQHFIKLYTHWERTGCIRHSPDIKNLAKAVRNFIL